MKDKSVIKCVGVEVAFSIEMEWFMRVSLGRICDMEEEVCLLMDYRSMKGSG